MTFALLDRTQVIRHEQYHRIVTKSLQEFGYHTVNEAQSIVTAIQSPLMSLLSAKRELHLPQFLSLNCSNLNHTPA